VEKFAECSNKLEQKRQKVGRKFVFRDENFIAKLFSVFQSLQQQQQQQHLHVCSEVMNKM